MFVLKVRTQGLNHKLHCAQFQQTDVELFRRHPEVLTCQVTKVRPQPIREAPVMMVA